MTEPETSDCWDTSISLGMPLQNRISGRSPPWNKPLHVLDTGRRTQSCSLCWWAQWCRRICVPGPWISHHADSPSSHLSRPWMENQRMEPGSNDHMTALNEGNRNTEGPAGDMSKNQRTSDPWSSQVSHGLTMDISPKPHFSMAMKVD